jgi:hypothetical protein
MTESNPGRDKTEHSRGDQDIERGAKKKPYRKPAYRYQRVFETMALACGKVQTTQGGCHFNRKFS